MKDIEVFILTRNRLELLKYSINSILNQTHKVKLTIVDNDSSDETEQYVTNLMKENDNLKYYRQPEFVPFEKNLKTAQELAKEEYVMFFHDDDVLNPQYIEAAYKLVNEYDNVDLVCGLLTSFHNNDEIDFHKLENAKYAVYENKYAFTNFIYSAFFTCESSILFPHVIYKTKNIKNIKVDSKKYGKIADKPFVLDSIQDGKCIQIKEKSMLMYRVHESQDSATSKNGPFPEEIINHHRNFKEIMSKDFYSTLRFNAYANKWLQTLYDWGNNDAGKFKDFIKEAYLSGAINKYTYNIYFGFIPVLNKRINKILMKIIRYQDKHEKTSKLSFGDV